jgi:hypothetical protein
MRMRQNQAYGPDGALLAGASCGPLVVDGEIESREVGCPFMG